jgi:vacuolar-type H+-ATPase subunit I/STV1
MELKNPDILLKFNRLNEEYNKIAIEGYGDFHNEFLEEDTKEYTYLQTLKEVNNTFDSKFNSLKLEQEHIKKLEDYKNKIECLLKLIQDVDKQYNSFVEESQFSFNRSDIPRIEPRKTDTENLQNVYIAVNDIIRIHTAKISIINQNITEYKKVIDNCLLAEQKKTVISEYNNNKLLCSICYINDIDIAIVPCGHTFCGKCTEQMTAGCFMCQKQVHSKVRLFISNSIISEVKSYNSDILDNFTPIL